MRANAVVATALLGLTLALAGPAAAGVEKTIITVAGAMQCVF
mgnify:CR=1 FL=1